MYQLDSSLISYVHYAKYARKGNEMRIECHGSLWNLMCHTFQQCGMVCKMIQSIRASMINEDQRTTRKMIVKIPLNGRILI